VTTETDARPTEAEQPQPLQVQLDPNVVAEILQQKNSKLVSTLVYENATLEAALDKLTRDNAEMRAQMEAMKTAMLAPACATPPDSD